MRAFVPPLLPLSARPRHFRKLFESYGASVPFSDNASPLAVVEALHGIPVSDELFRALDDLDILGEERGLFAFEEAAAVARVKIPKAIRGTAVALWAMRKRDPHGAVARALEMAHLRIARVAPELTRYERVAESPKDPIPLPRAEAVFRSRCPDARAVFFATDEAAQLRIAIVRAERSRTCTVENGGGAVHRNVGVMTADAIRINIAEGRVAIDTRDPRRVRPYADLVGEAYFGTKQFYGDGPAFTPKAFTLSGTTTFGARQLPVGVTRERLVECGWSDGERAYWTAKGSNALAAYEAHGGPSGGYVAAGVARFGVAAGEREVDVAFRLPHQLRVREARYEGLVRQALRGLGFFSPGVIPDDLWTMAPWTHPRWRWRKLVGEHAFDELVSRGVLKEVRGRLIGGDKPQGLGWELINFPLKLQPGKLYGVAEDLSIPSCVVGKEETIMWTLDVPKLALRLRQELGLSFDEGVRGESVAEDLGTVGGPGQLFRIFAVLRAPGAARAMECARTIRKASKTGTPIILVPTGRSLGGVLHEIEVETAELLGMASLRRRVYASIEEAYDTGPLRAPWELAQPDTRLVVSKRGEESWFDGVRVLFAGNEWALVRALSELGPDDAEEGADLEARIFPKHQPGVAKNVAVRVRSRLRDALVSAGRDGEEGAREILSYTKGKGWRIGVRFEVR